MHAFVCIKCVSPNSVFLLLLILQRTCVNLCCCLSLWQESIKSWTWDCDLSAKSRGRDVKLQKGTVSTRHKSPAVLAEKLNSIGQVDWFLYKYSMFQICDGRKIYIWPLFQCSYFMRSTKHSSKENNALGLMTKTWIEAAQFPTFLLSSSTLTWVNICLGKMQRHSGLHNWTILALYYYWHFLQCLQER